MWGEVPLPEDLESEKDVQTSRSLLDDDEDFAADGPSGGGAKLFTQSNSKLKTVAHSCFSFSPKSCPVERKMAAHRSPRPQVRE